jgi:hypothetical protein
MNIQISENYKLSKLLLYTLIAYNTEDPCKMWTPHQKIDVQMHKDHPFPPKKQRKIRLLLRCLLTILSIESFIWENNVARTDSWKYNIHCFHLRDSEKLTVV